MVPFMDSCCSGNRGVPAAVAKCESPLLYNTVNINSLRVLRVFVVKHILTCPPAVAYNGAVFTRPMSDWLTVLLNIAAMFLVILAGWVARRRAYLTAETTATLSRFVVDVTIPALVFTQMLRTADPDALRANWFVPLLGGGVLLLGLLVGYATLSFSHISQRNTYVFLVSITNWIYLPLPIIQALYHDEGVRTVLLFNVGAQLVLWSVGMWALRGGKPDLESLRALVLNTGLIATAVGILIAVFVPASRTLETIQIIPPRLLAPVAIVKALGMIGSLTIPLSLIVTGAQLGGLDISAHRPSRTLSGVLVARLLITPAVMVLLVWLGACIGISIPLIPRMTACIIAAMPVAVSCSIFTERFGGDTPLAAQSIFYSTLISIASVPLIFYLIQQAMAHHILPL